MEKVGNLINLESHQDLLPQPDLLEVFGERQVTLFGVTGTFNDLARLCPVDLSGPQITLEAKNEFIVKAANEAGLEIEPEHELLFSRVIEEQGLERKFIVAQPGKTNQVKDPVLLNDPASIAEKVSDNSASQKQPNQVKPDKRVQELPDPYMRDVIAPDILAKEYTEAASSELVERQIDVEEVVQELGKVSDGELQNTETNVSEQFQALVEDLHVQQTREPSTIVSQQEVSATKSQLSVQENKGLELIEVSAIRAFDEQPTTDELQEVVATEASVWGAELLKDDMEVYEDFNEAFLAFIGLNHEADIDTEGVSSVTIEGDEAQDSTPPLTEAAFMLAQRLELLDPDEIEKVAPVLRDIIGAVHGLLLLEEREASSESIEITHEQLEELCMQLFELLEIEYDDGDIEQLVSVLLNPKFKFSYDEEPKLSLVDLTRDGTHEAKHLRLYKSDPVNPRGEVNRVIGMFALLDTRMRSVVANIRASEQSIKGLAA